MNRKGLKWWQMAIVLNFVVSFFSMLGINVEHPASLFILVYTVVSVYLLKYVPVSKIKGYDDIA